MQKVWKQKISNAVFKWNEPYQSGQNEQFFITLYKYVGTYLLCVVVRFSS